MNARRRTLIAVFTLMLVAAAGFIVARRSGSSSGQRSQSPKTQAERLAIFDNSMRSLEDGDRRMPRDHWDPDYVVSTVGKNRETLRAWVRDKTSWIPYRGVLRGASGVLMDRQGNSLDRAILLATLLEKAGHNVRLAHVQLAQDQAVQLIPELLRHTHPNRQGTQTSKKSGATAEELKTQGDGVTALFNELSSRVMDQSVRILTQVHESNPVAEWNERVDKTLAAAQDHWWVQAEDGNGWSDLDISGFDSLTASETFTLSQLPSDLYHTLVIRVIGERSSDTGVKEFRVLEGEIRPMDIVAEPIVLQFWPGSWPKEVHPDPNSEFGLRGQALKQDTWSALLMAGDSNIASGTLQQNAETTTSHGGGGLGGLGLGIARAIQQPPAQSKSQLSATWIEYEIRTPGETPRIMRRAVFDLFGPAARASGQTNSLVVDDRMKLTRSLALMMRTEMLPVTSRLAPEFVQHLAMQSLAENKQAMRMIAEKVATPDSIVDDSIMNHATSPLSPLYSLSLARLAWSPFANGIYVDRIGLLTRHRHAGMRGNDYVVRSAIEILAGDVGVSLTVPDALTARGEQGILDANAQSLWWTGIGLNNAGEAFRLSKDWLTLASEDSEKVNSLSLPADSKVEMKKDLANGLVIVAPQHTIDVGPDQFAGWWRIDPSTGVIQSTPGSGWSQCASEYSMHLRMAATFARSFAFEYALCQGMAQAANSFKIVAAELQARDLFFWWAPPVKPGESPVDVIANNNKACLIGAMLGGMLATMPLVLIQAERWSEFGLVTAEQQAVINSAKVKSGTFKTTANVDPKFPMSNGPPPAGSDWYEPMSTEKVAPEDVIPGVKPQPVGDKTVDLGKTQSEASPKGAPPDEPIPDNPTAEYRQQAWEELKKAQDDYRKAWDEMMAYRDKYPAEGWKGAKTDHPGYDPEVQGALANDMWNKAGIKEVAADKYKKVMSARAAHGNVTPVPAPAPAPTPNADIALDATQLKDSFWPFSWH